MYTINFEIPLHQPHVLVPVANPFSQVLLLKPLHNGNLSMMASKICPRLAACLITFLTLTRILIFFKPSFLTSQNSMDSELMTALACNQSGWGINPGSWCYLWIKFVVGSQSSLRRLGWACSQPSGAACRGDSHLQSCHGYLPAFLELNKVPRQLSRLQLPSWPLLMMS